MFAVRDPGAVTRTLGVRIQLRDMRALRSVIADGEANPNRAFRRPAPRRPRPIGRHRRNDGRGDRGRAVGLAP